MAAPPAVCHLTTAPCLCGSLGFPQKLSSCSLPPSHPPRLSPHSQWQSSSWLCSPVSILQLLALMHTSGHMSWSGACRAVAWAICLGLLCLVCHRLAVSSSSNSLRCCPSNLNDFPISEQVSQMWKTLLFLITPRGSSHHSFSPLLFPPLLCFILPGYTGIFLILTGVQALLIVFSWYSERTMSSLYALLMHL